MGLTGIVCCLFESPASAGLLFSGKLMRFLYFRDMFQKVVLFCLLLALSNRAHAHEFYFAYAEIAYNELSNRFEGTLIFTTHDLERALAPNGSLIGKLENSDESSPIRAQLEKYINQHLNISYGCALDSNAFDAFCQTDFILEGIAPQLNGTIECFVSAPARLVYIPTHFGLPYLTTLQVQFDALFEAFSGQQNKLTLIYRNQKETLNYIPGKNIQSIPLKP